jgi:hypothetical protein
MDHTLLLAQFTLVNMHQLDSTGDHHNTHLCNNTTGHNSVITIGHRLCHNPTIGQLLFRNRTVDHRSVNNLTVNVLALAKASLLQLQ